MWFVANVAIVAENHALVICGFLLTALSVLCVTLRTITRMVLAFMRLEDWLAIIATFGSVGFLTASMFSVSLGLGDVVPPARLQQFLQVRLATIAAYNFTQLTVKFSTLVQRSPLPRKLSQSPRRCRRQIQTLAQAKAFHELCQNIGLQGPPLAIIEPEEVKGDLGISDLFPQEEYEAVDPDNGVTNERIGCFVRDVKSAEKTAERLGIIEKTSTVINVTLNVSACICIRFLTKKEFEQNQPTGIEVLDKLEKWRTALNVESAVVPVVGNVVGVLCIIINFMELFVHHSLPEDAQQYLDNNKDGYISSLPQKPDPTYTYAVAPTRFSSSGHTTVNSIFFQFSVGSVEANLLTAPALANEATNTAARDPITHAITSGGDEFLISGPPAVADGGSSISVNDQAKISAGSGIAATGLTFIITGTGYGVAGVAQVIVNESTNNRPDQRVLPSIYLQETLRLGKV
ncbi:uncharacterized protein FMAN_00086 [Fusarium mangiferae]|uniref:Uncharacterized protein n=1 Tax=Fusarium mangiferae TaxID=192010 RepID=A0A1L7U095_FUSMA|nr:uncharacterized protein FMAN_00086 [Fusarium mangiferae]CVL02582.1 uncharacterized protein FMAN_00086 [Fusarium mangiferae]